MKWRLTGLLLAALVSLASFLLACSGSDQPAGPLLRMVLAMDTSGAGLGDIEDLRRETTDIIQQRAAAFGGRADIRNSTEGLLVVEVADIEASVARRLLARRGLLEFRQPKLDEHGNVLLCEGGAVTYDPPGCAGQEVPVSTWAYEPLSPDADQAIWVPALATGSDGAVKEVTGHFLKPSSYVDSDFMGEPVLNFEMTAEGGRLLEELTWRLVDYPLAFFLDGEPIRGADGRIIAPVIAATVSDEGSITGLSSEDARLLSVQMNSGALPLPVDVIEVQVLRD